MGMLYTYGQDNIYNFEGNISFNIVCKEIIAIT